MGEAIHWGVCNALRHAADVFIKEEREEIEFLKERLHFADAEGNDAEHLGKNIESAVQRVDEVKKFKEALTDAELQGNVEGLLDDNVRPWLLLGLNQLSDTGKWSEEFIRSEKWRLENGLMPDEQLFMFQTYRLLRRLPEVISDAEVGKLAADEQVEEKQQLIKWLGTKEDLEQLAGELKNMKIIDDADIFSGQFQCNGVQAVAERCQWLKGVNLLVYLFDRLKELEKVFRKRCTDNTVSNHFYNDIRAPVQNFRQARRNYRNNTRTLTGEPNSGDDGVPDGADIIERILKRIAQ